jgi:dephospho-CoA kinase
MLRVGLTGGIACGKSQVLRRLELRGCRTLDLDRVAHDVMAPGGSAHADVVAAFGPGILRADGAVDRKALGALVFQDHAARERLNQIVHPRVRIEERRRVAALAGEAAAVVVVDAALLVEAGLHLRFDRLVVVHCAPDEQLRRLMERDGLSRVDAEARLRAQMTAAEKRRFAHLEVDTSGSLAETDAAADALAAILLALAKRAVEQRVVSRERLTELLLQDARADGDRQAAARFLEGIAEAGGIELVRVARLAGRSGGSPWLALPGDRTPIVPAALMPPVSAWCLARRGLDDELLGLAAMSVARAVTAEPRAVARACLAAWRASRKAWGQAGEGGARDALGFARRWSGTEAEAEEPVSPDSGIGGTPELATAIDRFVTAAQAWVRGGDAS